MKKVTISGAIIIAIVLYGILHNTNTGIQAATSNANTSGARYKDGTYTGSVADAFYGSIQVQATVNGGKLTNVAFLQYPNDRGRSIAINQYADPILAQEAVQSQTAQVDTVSGATDTSQAFIQSLSSALSQSRS